jgi:type I restriction enzyme S subunit
MNRPATQHKRAAYPAYKPSGVAWLGDVPEHWEIKALKRTFTTLNGATPRSGDPNYWDGDIPWATPDDLGSLKSSVLTTTRRMITEEGYASCGVSLAPEGSLILSTRAPIGHLAVAGISLCTNQGCRSLVFRNDDDRRFFFYQLFAARLELQSLGQGSTFTELSRDRLTPVYLASPSLDEQRAIAAFLDRETARIDALIEKKRRQIELLQEKRSALISHAVTKGLDPKAKMPVASSSGDKYSLFDL